MLDLDLPDNIKLLKIDLDAMEIFVRLYPDEGPFQGAQVDFEIKIPPMYPHSPPKTRILHKVINLISLDIMNTDSQYLLVVPSQFRSRGSRLFKHFEAGLESCFTNYSRILWLVNSFTRSKQGRTIESR